MDFKSKLNQIKVLLGLQVKMASDKLIDGTEIEAEAFEVGYPLFVINEDSTLSPAPAGDHEVESGKILTVDETGTIVSIKEKEMEAEKPETETEVEVEMASIVGDVVPEVETEMSGTPVQIEEALKNVVMAVEGIVKDVTEIKEEMARMKEKYETFSKLPAGNKIPKVIPSEDSTPLSNLEARIEALNKLKNENFFKIK